VANFDLSVLLVLHEINPMNLEEHGKGNKQEHQENVHTPQELKMKYERLFSLLLF